MSDSSNLHRPPSGGAEGPPPPPDRDQPAYGRYLPPEGSGVAQPYQGFEAGFEPVVPDGPPRPLRIGVSLMWVGAALSILSAVVAYFMVDTVNALVARELSAQGMPELATPEFLDLMEGAIVVGLVAGGVISAGLWAWMAVKNGQGRAWARVVGTVLAGLYVLNFLSGLAQAGASGTAVLGALQVGMAVTIVVLMWQPASSGYYTARSARRG